MPGRGVSLAFDEDGLAQIGATKTQVMLLGSIVAWQKPET